MNIAVRTLVALAVASSCLGLQAAKKPRPKLDHAVQEEKGRCITYEAFTNANPGLKLIGRLKTRSAKEIKSNRWSIGCECLDRDYADFDEYRDHVGALGCKYARIQSGWMKCERKKGVYDMAWLDEHVDGLREMSVEPWMCLCYGNPIYGTESRLGGSIGQVVRNPEAFAAWLAYCKAVVTRYRERVRIWEIWNEPFHQAEDYKVMVLETAKAIREVQPDAKVHVTSIHINDYRPILEYLKEHGGLKLVNGWIYHSYARNPDDPIHGWWNYRKVDRTLKMLREYDTGYYVIQGEGGCPAQLEYMSAMNNYGWTEYSQAKWVMRRMASDSIRSIPCHIYTIIDQQYKHMLETFGLIRSSTLKLFGYKRPSYYGVQNMTAFFDDDVKPVRLEKPGCRILKRADIRETGERSASAAIYSRFGSSAVLVWYSDRTPSDAIEWDRCEVSIPGVSFSDPVWVEMVTGRVYEIADGSWRSADGATVFDDLPVWDCPSLIAERKDIILK